MADLIDRISGNDGEKINLHRWVGVQRLYTYGLFTRSNVAADFGFIANADDTRQATQLADQIDAQSNTSNKALYIARVEAVFYCLEDDTDTLYHTNGVINKALVFSHLSIAG